MPHTLICPACGEPAQHRPPRRWPAAHGPAAAYSHLDGEPLCPVPTDNGSQPATPVDIAGALVPTTSAPATQADATEWQQILHALGAVGAAAGRDAADWWLQHPLGGHAIGDPRPAAARILAGLTDGDPEILDTLPCCDLSGRWADNGISADVYRSAAPEHATRWDDLDAEQRDEAAETYCVAHDCAAHHHIEAYCRDLLAGP